MSSPISYREVYMRDPIVARLMLIKYWESCGSIRRTAIVFKTSRLVVRRALRRYNLLGEAGLANRSCRPHRMPLRTGKEIEQAVIQERKRTNFGAVHLRGMLRMRGIELSVSTIGNVLRRYGLSKRRKLRSVVGKRTRYYDFTKLYPLSEFQVDLKEILDARTLPMDVYKHLSHDEFPRYQWTAIDVYSRLRFLAYSEEKSFANGLAFMLLVLLWLRGFGVRGKVRLQTDWGEEFGGSSERKLNRLQKKFLSPLSSELIRIPKGKKEYNGCVERSHRMDDEYFYIPCGTMVEDGSQWFNWGLRWITYYNVRRHHYGRGMNGMPPLTKLRSVHPEIHPAIACFPPLLLDNISTHKSWKGGNYVLDNYSLL